MAVQILTRTLPLLTLVACTSDHHVSPFPPIDLATVLRPRDNLSAQLARAIQEAEASGLHESLRKEGVLPDGHPFLALGFTGTDATGMPIHATRVVTPASVVLALGPAKIVMQEPPQPDELLPSLLPSGAFPSCTDLTGDQIPDVIVRSSNGVLAIHRITLQGSAPYPIFLRAKPTQALDLNEDGFPDLAGAPPVDHEDSISPTFLDVAISDKTSFRNDHPAALAYHRQLAQTPLPASTAPLSLRLRTILERAFHGACAGDPLATTLQPATELVAANHPLPNDLAASWARWHNWLIHQFQQ